MDLLSVVFQLLLGSPQLGVMAAGGQQLFVGAAFHHPAAIHHIDSVCIGHMDQPVGDQNHSLGFRQLMNLSHDIGFTFHVNVGAVFIEEVHRAVVEQCASKRQPLALAAREIRRLLCQPGIQSLRFSEEVRQLHLLQRHPPRHSDSP